MEKINRRDFLKTLGVGAAGAAVASCTPKKDSLYDPKGNHTEPVPVGQMTYRTHNVSGNKVSILGYGCMRWPMIPNPMRSFITFIILSLIIMSDTSLYNSFKSSTT